MTNKAFTLVEVMIASAILAISLTMIIAAAMTFKGSVYSADLRVNAMHVGRNEIENLLSLPYDDPLLQDGMQHSFSNSGIFTGTYNVATDSNYPGTKKITLTVYWKNPGAKITLSNTIISAISEALH